MNTMDARRIRYTWLRQKEWVAITSDKLCHPFHKGAPLQILWEDNAYDMTCKCGWGPRSEVSHNDEVCDGFLPRFIAECKYPQCVLVTDGMNKAHLKSMYLEIDVTMLQPGQTLDFKDVSVLTTTGWYPISQINPEVALKMISIHCGLSEITPYCHRTVGNVIATPHLDQPRENMCVVLFNGFLGAQALYHQGGQWYHYGHAGKARFPEHAEISLTNL